MLSEAEESLLIIWHSEIVLSLKLVELARKHTRRYRFTISV